MYAGNQQAQAIGGAGGAAREPEIVATVSELDKRMASLTANFEHLLQRLTPVLQNVPPSADKDGNELRPTRHCPLGEQLQANIDQLRRLDSWVQAALGRLEV